MRSRALLVRTALILSVPILGATAPPAEAPPPAGAPSDRRALLDEALADARRIKDRTASARALLAVGEALAASDPARGIPVLEEVAALVPRLPQGPSFWEQISSTLVAGALYTVTDAFAPPQPAWMRDLKHAARMATMPPGAVPPLSHAYHPPLTEKNRRSQEVLYAQEEIDATAEAYRYEQRLRDLRSRDALALATVRLLAPRRVEPALALARSIGDDAVRGRALELTLESWPPAERDAASRTARELGSAARPSARLLVSLARGVEAHDRELARELVRRAAEASPANEDAGEAWLMLARLDPGALDAELGRLLEGKRPDPERIAAFGATVAPLRPDLGFKALASIEEEERLLPARGMVVRALAAGAGAAERAQVKSLARSLLAAAPDYRPVMGTEKNMRKELRKLGGVSDAIVALGAVDLVDARTMADGLSFSEGMQFMFLDQRGIGFATWSGAKGMIEGDKETRKELRQTFFRDVARLDLALSRLDADPAPALALLASLDAPFWDALAYTAMRGEVPLVRAEKAADALDPEGIQSRLATLLTGVKTRWPEAVEALAVAHPEEAAQAWEHCFEGGERIDRVAARIVARKKKSRRSWPEFLPFSLTISGATHAPRDLPMARRAFTRAHELALAMEPPADTWALVSNAAVWNAADPAGAREAAAEAATRARELGDAGPWEGSLPRLLAQLASFDPEAAVALARRTREAELRVLALVAAASAPGPMATAP